MTDPANPADRPRPRLRLNVAVETRRLLRLALPLMGAQLAQMGMGVTDAVMAGRYGSEHLAGVALGASLMWPMILLAMGVVQSVTPTVSQLAGARNYQAIGEVIRQGLWLALCGGVTVALLLSSVGPVYVWLDVDPVASAISIPYLRMCAFGLPALICFFCLRFLADGMGFTRPALLISVVALGCKIPLNYVLIHGLFGLPELGGVGCGVAQAIVMWVQLTAILLVVTRPRFDVTTWRSRFSWPNWQRIRPLLILGLPIGTTIFAEMGLFSLTTLLLGRYGAETVAAHNIAMNLNGVVFMLPMSLGIAATIRIGHQVGAGRLWQARGSAVVAMGLAVLLAVCAALLLALLRWPIVNIYTTEAAVATQAATLLLFVVFFQLFDGSQSAAVGCLRGYKDTRRPMTIALFSYWGVGLPMECALGFGWFGEPWGLYGFWAGLYVGLGVAAVLLCYRLWHISGDLSQVRRLSALQG